MFIIVYVILCVYIYVHKYRMGGVLSDQDSNFKAASPQNLVLLGIPITL